MEGGEEEERLNDSSAFSLFFLLPEMCAEFFFFGRLGF